MRGLDYYTRTVFEVDVRDAGVGAIGGGGRYDGLVELEGGKPTPGIGFAVGFERISLALKTLGSTLETEPEPRVFVACTPDARAAAFSVTRLLRAAGIRTEADYQGRSLKGQFKLADKIGSRVVVVLESDEVAAGGATVRDMQTHEQTLVPLDQLADLVASKL